MNSNSNHPLNQTKQRELTDEQLQELLQIANEATGGPWSWGSNPCESKEKAIEIFAEHVNATKEPIKDFYEVWTPDGKRTAIIGNGPTALENSRYIAVFRPEVAILILRRLAEAEGQLQEMQELAGDYAELSKKYKDKLAETASRLKVLENADKAYMKWMDVVGEMSWSKGEHIVDFYVNTSNGKTVIEPKKVEGIYEAMLQHFNGYGSTRVSRAEAKLSEAEAKIEAVRELCRLPDGTVTTTGGRMVWSKRILKTIGEQSEPG